jgi:hypothetical protein
VFVGMQYRVTGLHNVNEGSSNHEEKRFGSKCMQKDEAKVSLPYTIALHFSPRLAFS